MKLLRGFTVLDLGTFITAPYAAMLLAELGADVIKVERPEGGDPFRWFAGGLSSPHFQAHNRHKRSVALDYTTPDGLKLLHSLIEHADALVINVRPGVEQRLTHCQRPLRAQGWASGSASTSPPWPASIRSSYSASLPASAPMARTRTAPPTTMSV